jgi:hypothetical protein
VRPDRRRGGLRDAGQHATARAEAEVHRARSCVVATQWELNEVTDRLGEPLTDVDVRRSLTNAGFDAITVEPASFAARVGKACVLGTYTPDDAQMIVTPVPPSGDCDPE